MDKVKTIINIRVDKEVMDKINSMIDAKLPESSGVKMDAAGLVLTELLQKFFEKSVSCNDEERELEISSLKEDVESLAQHNAELKENLKAAISWQMPVRLGAIVVQMLKDQNDFADVQTPEQACDRLLRGYWNRGVFVADQSEIDEYIEAKKHEFGQQQRS